MKRKQQMLVPFSLRGLMKLMLQNLLLSNSELCHLDLSWFKFMTDIFYDMICIYDRYLYHLPPLDVGSSLYLDKINEYAKTLNDL
ncbi:hypothetical protein DPEC_G00273450 [Dallia pectoralis]|uniref:Uncharacterized protein n=1 Tax=Dallia pectoralis TaxID=75939 RepID=A0ACC2FQA0_DALPE|nr:hypothetical protein DPEC_G00273450 [Dallia pectoralis]